MRWYSCSIGSLTLRIRSPVPHTSSAVGRILAPAATYSSLLIEEPTPASDSTKTSCPLRTSSWTPAGVMATRYSWFLTSLGMPTFMAEEPFSRSRWLTAAVNGTDDGALFDNWELPGTRFCGVACCLHFVRNHAH